MVGGLSFFTELRRRNVFRVGIAYLIGSWLLAQIADLLIDNIGAPDWVMKTLFVVLALGFFLSLFFAWAFEMTPDGVKRESEVDRSRSIVKTTGRKLDRSIIVILVLALGYFAWDKFSTQPEAVAPVTQVAPAAVEEAVIDKSIAVLPFVNMSADADNEYFSDGLSEELLNLLAKVDGLKVAARTSSFKFKNSEADIAEIGSKLNVATVLEGSVRKSGNQARITAQLIKVDDGFHMWSETYDRDLDNIFEVQDEIARAIVDALKLPLLGHNAQPLTSRSTDSFAAYDLYLLGRHHARQYTEPSLERARDYFLEALKQDPALAPAHAGLADTYVFLSDFGDLPEGEAIQLARSAAEKALSIDPDSPEANTSMGLLARGDGYMTAAEKHFKKALEVNPGHVNALVWYRQVLNSQFKVNEAMALVERALVVDPLSSIVSRHHAQQLIMMDRFTEADDVIQAMIANNPDDPTPYELWGNLFLSSGMPHKAIPMYRNAHRLRPADIYMAAQNVQASLDLNDKGLVDYWLEQAQSRGSDGQWTLSAEKMVMYSSGNFEDLLEELDDLLKTQPEHLILMMERSSALMQLGRFEDAIETMKQALSLGGFQAGSTLSNQQIMSAVQLANAYDTTGNHQARDQLLEQATQLLIQIRKNEPPQMTLFLAEANIASVRNDLPGTLRNLALAKEIGFRQHWQLTRNPVFSRWQKNPEFIAFHQEMLDDAARMRGEYYVNNAAEQSAAALEGGL